MALMLLRIFLLILWIPLLHAWTHLELGAGNYGASKGKRTHDPNVQYRVLFWTVEELVDRYGEEGTIYVNDYKEPSCHYCAERLSQYIEMQGYPIQVIPLVADFRTLRWTGSKFDTIHLKNPEPNFLRKSDETRAFLQRLASYSKNGLHLFILYSDTFFPEREKENFVNQGIFYHPAPDWEAVDYYGPSGHLIQGGRVFHIQP